MPIPPKHVQLADDLRQRISSGLCDDGLPSEAELREELRYSRSTIRKAFSSLENEGLVVAGGGVRRQVRRNRRWTWSMTTWEREHTASEDAWALSVSAQGGEPSTQTTVHIEPATAAVAAELQVDKGSRVVVRRRVRSIDGVAHHLADSHFPYWLAEENPKFLEPGDISAPGGLLADAGRPQARVRDHWTARMPTPHEARVLSAPAGVPLLVNARTGYAHDGTPLRHMVTRMVADQVDVTYELQLTPEQVPELEDANIEAVTGMVADQVDVTYEPQLTPEQMAELEDANIEAVVANWTSPLAVSASTQDAAMFRGEANPTETNGIETRELPIDDPDLLRSLLGREARVDEPRPTLVVRFDGAQKLVTASMLVVQVKPKIKRMTVTITTPQALVRLPLVPMSSGGLTTFESPEATFENLPDEVTVTIDLLRG